MFWSKNTKLQKKLHSNITEFTLLLQTSLQDECHLLKNYKTARCKAAMPILQVGMLLEQCR